MVVKLILKLLGGYFGLRKKILHSNKISRLLYKLILKAVQHEFGAYLPYNNIIEGPISFPHGLYGIFISIGSKIGKDCVIFQHVTIGSNMLIDSKNFGYPTIGNNCYIGAGAKIIGNVSVGNNCRIGANCVVVSDVPDNCVVVSQQPKIILKKKLNNTNYFLSKTGYGYRKDGKFILETNVDYLKKLNNRNGDN